jgi:two-component system nitrogen regulation sensor histidine kinase NtrY
MASDLQTSRQQLLKAERMAAWQEVARQISHEIKNSLTPISISLRRLRNQGKESALPVKMTDSLNAIEAELRVLEKMAAEFSAFARMPEPEKVLLHINDLIKSTVLLLTPRFKEHKLITRLSEDLDPIQADGEQLKQVINNLIKNSVEASPPKKPVTITTKQADSQDYLIEIEITDQGKGLNPDEIDKLFKPYYTTKMGGTGLGLTIVQKIVESHSGRILVESEPGHGTRIRLQL